jgi:hypothetical protein
MDYNKTPPQGEDDTPEAREPAVAYGTGTRTEADRLAASILGRPEGGDEDCGCPLCLAKRIPYELAELANARLDAGYEKYADLLIECRRRGYNEDTINAIKESLDADEGKIQLKSYATVEEMNADIDAEEDDE